MKKNCRKRLVCLLLIAAMSVAQMCSATANAADISGLASESRLPIVLTLGADLSEEQKTQVLQYFGIDISEVTVVTITNQDEFNKLGNLISAEKIGTHTYSCALVNPTNAGGIQVKTANMNYVTSNMIAGQLSTSGVYNCEVLTAAPFEVSGTGALTGVMMAYEKASGVPLDEDKKELANVELVTTGNIAETVGQDQATLIVNDIKIHIVRDQVTEQQEVYDVVDNVIQVTETAAAEAAANQGKEAPAKLGEVEHTQLYDFSYKFSQMDYDYAQMQPTLERVTHNITTSTGIDDPITDTFTTITEEPVLSSDSILLGTNDEIWGDDAIINATNSAAVSDRPAEPINVYTGEVTLTSAGGVKADEFIPGTNIIAYKDVNGSYALMDLNGKLLTESIYDRDIVGRKGYITAKLNDGSGKSGILAADGSVVVDFQYDVVSVVGNMWATGCVLTGGGTEDNYDYTDYDNYYLIDHVDFYYIGTQGTQCVGTLTRDECYEVESRADYINVQARTGVITTYDSSFTPVQTTDQLYNFGPYDYDKSLEETLSERTGCYVGSFCGKYAQISGDGGYGIVDRYGNIIVPMQFGSFETDYSDGSYEAGGYFVSTGAEQTQFVTAGGTVTGSFPYGYNTENSISACGMTARVKKSDDGILLLAADGVESDLGTTYGYLSVIQESKGLLWAGDTGSGYDLIDWHGNVLLSGSGGYSMSANGNYLISQDGYTSSTLYMVNDAEPVDIANSTGGAQELVFESGEGASLEAYTGDPTAEKVSEMPAEGFITGTDLLKATNDGTKYAVMDVTGRQLTNPQFLWDMDCEDGFLMVYDADTQKCGVLNQKAQLVVPCEFDTVKVLNGKWIVAYVLKPAEESDHDFKNWTDDSYYQIDTAKVYYVSEEETSSVELTRDQLKDAYAEGDYLNIEDRASGTVTTYDSSFTAVASADYLSDFGDFSYNEVMYRQLSDKSGHDVNLIGDDGYAEVNDYNSDTGEFRYGVIDLNGEEIIPLAYDRVETCSGWDTQTVSANGYFCVKKGGMTGYVTRGGEVSCELKYGEDSFENNGMSGVYDKGDGTFLIVAADGTEAGPYPYRPHSYGHGLFYGVTTIDNKNILVDWHGNELLSNYYTMSFAESGKYFVVRMEYDSPAELYTVDGAEVVGVSGSAPDSAGTGAESQETEPDTAGAVPAESGTAQTEMKADEGVTAQTEANADETVTAPAETETSAAPAEDSGENAEPASQGGGAEEASQLLQSASALVSADITANGSAIKELLKQAQAKAEQDYPEAASIIGSAAVLLDTESPDANVVGTLISSALSMLQ